MMQAGGGSWAVKMSWRLAPYHATARNDVQENKLGGQRHGTLVYRALASSVKDASVGLEAGDGLELLRLFTASSKHGDLFSAQEREALDALGIRGAMRSQLLTTDDSFVFNKVVGKVKDAASALGPPDGGAEATEASEEPPVGESLAELRRELLVDCLESTKTVYVRPWTRTSVDLLVEHFRQHLDSFGPGHRERIGVMVVYVKEQRAARKQVRQESPTVCCSHW